jgi:hypothetical protein
MPCGVSVGRYDRTNTAKTTEKGWELNAGNCKNCDSPISPSDPQASKTISGGFPHEKIMSKANTLLGFWGQVQPRMRIERACVAKQANTPRRAPTGAQA